MQLKKEKKQSAAIKIIATDNGRVLGRAYLYLIYNDLHQEPYGLAEDVFVENSERGKGVGTELVKAIIAEAREQKCYKLIGTSRDSRGDVHDWYESLGFKRYGVEFRMDLSL